VADQLVSLAASGKALSVGAIERAHLPAVARSSGGPALAPAEAVQPTTVGGRS